MTEVWPLNVSRKLAETATDAMRPFRCLLLMPFHESFDEVTEIIRDTVSEVLSQFQDLPGPPVIDRLDWVTSAGAIQHQIWQRVFEADLVFCDITDYNPNVMFETGVCAAWKETGQVVLVKNHSCRTDSPFDIKPMRYIEYELAYRGIKSFKEKLSAVIREAIIRFPDSQHSSPGIALPYEKDFSDNRDDLAITTPPFAHRRVKDGSLEFGSLWVYSHSWASIGKKRFHDFSLEFSARFSNPLPVGSAFIGVGLRSQHWYANYAHVLYLNRDGIIVITEPDEEPPTFYKDRRLREPTSIDLEAYHDFHIRFDQSALTVQIDDFVRTFEVAGMKKTFGPGLIRFQSSQTWMAVRRLRVEAA